MAYGRRRYNKGNYARRGGHKRKYKGSRNYSGRRGQAGRTAGPLRLRIGHRM